MKTIGEWQITSVMVGAGGVTPALDGQGWEPFQAELLVKGATEGPWAVWFRRRVEDAPVLHQGPAQGVVGLAGAGTARPPRQAPGPGLYRVHWRSGGSSLAAVGVGRNGDRWLAPTNWVEPTAAPDWDEVEWMDALDDGGRMIP